MCAPGVVHTQPKERKRFALPIRPNFIPETIFSTPVWPTTARLIWLAQIGVQISRSGRMEPEKTAAAPVLTQPAAGVGDCGKVVWAVREHGQCWPAVIYRTPGAANVALAPGAAALPPDYDPHTQCVAVFLGGCTEASVIPISHTVDYEEGMACCAELAAAADGVRLESLCRAVREGCILSGVSSVIARTPSALTACRYSQSVWVLQDAAACEEAHGYMGSSVTVPLSYWLGGGGTCTAEVVSATRIKNSDYHGWGCSVKLDTTIRGRLEWHIPIHCMRRFPAAARVPAAGQANALRVDMRKYAKHLAAACEKQQNRRHRNRNKGECCVCKAVTYFVCPLCSPGGAQNQLFVCGGLGSVCFVRAHGAE
jgi:hypothetical protein